MNNAAYIMLANTPSEHAVLALDLSREAVRLWPEHRGFRGTLALSLIAGGSLDEGLDMSQAVLQEPELSDADRAGQLAISALGFLLRGERDCAVPLIDEAERLHHWRADTGLPHEQPGTLPGAAQLSGLSPLTARFLRITLPPAL